MRRLSLLLATVFALTCVIGPITASAQTGTSISGVVKDESGGALPGVTVEVSSPALIEKVRTAVTDGEGRYSIVSLRPGVYKVTFTLTGFGVVVREGIELQTQFTATIDAPAFFASSRAVSIRGWFVPGF